MKSRFGPDCLKGMSVAQVENTFLVKCQKKKNVVKDVEIISRKDTQTIQFVTSSS